MVLELDFRRGGESVCARVRATEVKLARVIGEPVSWACRLAVDAERTLLERLCADALAGDVRIDVHVRDGTDVALATGLRVARCGLDPENSAVLLVTGCGTLFGAGSEAEIANAFRPRRRVRTAANVAALFDQLADVVRMPPAVRNHLAALALSYGKRGCVVQDGLSDWDLARALAAQHDLFVDQPEPVPLVLTGSVEHHPNRWSLHWPHRRAWESVRDVERRTVDTDAWLPTGAQRAATLEGRDLRTCATIVERSLDGHYPALAAIERWNAGAFEASVWNSWTRRDLPLFWKGSSRTITGVTDRLTDAGADNAPTWHCQIELVASDSPLSWMRARAPRLAWIGLGVVEEHDHLGPWIPVRLDGFDDGANRAEARLSTPCSGSAGRTGLHLVPAAGSLVALFWPGDYRQPIVCAGNVRTERAELAAPSLSLDRELRARVAQVVLEALGPVELGTAVDIASEHAFTLCAGGVDVALDGNSFRTDQSSRHG